MRRGVTLVELLLVLVLSGLLLGSALAILGTLSRASALSMDRWDRLEAIRTVWVTLEKELRPGRPDADWRVDSDGTLRLRGFRGFARACGVPDASGSVPVAWRGERLPVADRDSVLVLDVEGRWSAARLTRWREAEVGCLPGEGEREGWMSWHPTPAESVILVRLFEAGRYTLTDGAFRYARGGGGRQPLTPEVFVAGSGFEALPDGLLVHLEARRHPGARAARRSVPADASGSTDAPTAIRFTLRVGEDG